jgi:aminoglycoside phosphotransferase (APT) family kinase protein
VHSAEKKVTNGFPTIPTSDTMNPADSFLFLEFLRHDGVVRHPSARITPLSGGVSSDIFLVDDGDDWFVVKRALPKLKVTADWFADVSRNQSEWEFILYVARFLPEAVPVLRNWSAEHGYFTMEFLGAEFRNWKQLLLAGETDVRWATQAGTLIAQIHRHSAGDAEAQRVFDTTPSFFQLRIEPYLLATGEKHPDLKPLFEAEARRLADTRECLVHGDFSPKNVLISRDRMVLLDCEVAWYGDPAFDLAFMLNHFLLKGLRHAPRDRGMKAMADAFRTAYQTAHPAFERDARVAHLLLMLMLARVDGKSPVEYLPPPQQDIVRNFVRRELKSPRASVSEVTDAWFGEILRNQS